MESYGKQKQITEPRLKEIIGELLAQGYLWATPDKYALIHLEEKGEDFLKGKLRQGFQLQGFLILLLKQEFSIAHPQ